MFVRINARVLNSGQVREVWYVLETEHRTMREVHDALVRDGQLYGTRYETTRTNDGRRVVKDAFEAIITREGLVSIMAMQEELVDTDGSVIWTFGDDDLHVGEAAE